MAFYNNSVLAPFTAIKYVPVTEKEMDKLWVLQDKLLHFDDIRVPFTNGNSVLFKVKITKWTLPQQIQILAAL